KLRRHALKLNTQMAPIPQATYLHVWTDPHAAGNRWPGNSRTSGRNSTTTLAKRHTDLDLTSISHHRQANGASRRSFANMARHLSCALDWLAVPLHNHIVLLNACLSGAATGGHIFNQRTPLFAQLQTSNRFLAHLAKLDP